MLLFFFVLESFVPRPSKRTKPSPETEDDDDDDIVEGSQHVGEEIGMPSPKVPKYAPTLGLLSPSQEPNSPPLIEIKEESEEPQLTNEVNAEKSGSTDNTPYSAHSSGKLKLVFKSSPAHAFTPEYKPESPQFIPSSSLEDTLNGVQNLVPVKHETFEEDSKPNSNSVPFQDYISGSSLVNESVEDLGCPEDKGASMEFPAENVSEDDAAVAGLLSVADSTESDVHLFDADFPASENEKFGGKHAELFTDSCVEAGTPISDQSDMDEAVEEIIDQKGVLEIEDSNDETSQFDTFNTDHDNDDTNASDDEEQLVKTENQIQLNNTRGENSLPGTADLPEALGGLNNEMESAINSILSLNDTGESDDFADMDDFMNRDASTDGQDDIEAAVQSILM